MVWRAAVLYANARARTLLPDTAAHHAHQMARTHMQLAIALGATLSATFEQQTRCDNSEAEGNLMLKTEASFRIVEQDRMPSSTHWVPL